MTCTLFESIVRRVLERMHAQADSNDPPLLAIAEGTTGDERAALLSEAFIPVDPDAGRLLYALVRGAAPGTVVEFGTSYGISTIYMAAAVRDRGESRVITTEILESKADKARDYIREAGLLDWVDIRVGDALDTLADLQREVSFVFLDGMKSLYLPVLRLLEPALRSGAMVVADDLALFPGPLKPYIEYVRDPSNGYASVTIPIGDTMELSTRTGQATVSASTNSRSS